MARCPECNAALQVSPELALYDRLYCEECGALLEVVSLSPVELEYVYDYGDLDDEERDVEWDDELEDEEGVFEEDRGEEER